MTQSTDINAVNDAQQEVVAPAISGTATGDGDGQADAVTAEFTTRRQSAAENAGFRKIRLENQKYQQEIQALRARLKDLDTLDAVQMQNKRYLDALVEERMRQDLDAIREMDPNVESLQSIGGDFIGLLESGVDAKVAFCAIKAAKESGLTRGKPPETGAVGVAQDAECEFFTSRELDRLTARDLDDPLIFKKAMKSLKRL